MSSFLVEIVTVPSESCSSIIFPALYRFFCTYAVIVTLQRIPYKRELLYIDTDRPLVFMSKQVYNSEGVRNTEHCRVGSSKLRLYELIQRETKGYCSSTQSWPNTINGVEMEYIRHNVITAAWLLMTKASPKIMWAWFNTGIRCHQFASIETWLYPFARMVSQWSSWDGQRGCMALKGSLKRSPKGIYSFYCKKKKKPLRHRFKAYGGVKNGGCYGV